MKKTSIYLAFVGIAMFSALTSCAPKVGCTDPASLTYNPEAEEDDGSCKYTADSYVGSYIWRDTTLLATVGIVLYDDGVGTISKQDNNTVILNNAIRGCSGDATVTDSTLTILPGNNCLDGLVMSFDGTTIRYRISDPNATVSGVAIKQ